MIFAKRYESLIFHGEDHELRDEICGDVDYRIRQKLVAVMEQFSQPIKLQCSRYDKDDTEETNAFVYACEQFNDIMNVPYIQTSYMHMNIMDQGKTNLAAYCLSFILSVIELQYDNLYDYQDEDSDPLFPYVINEKQDFMQSINSFMTENDLPWCMHDGKMIKIDAQQFECDLKAKAITQLHELKDAEPKFQSAYTELITAIESLENGNYQSAISNAEKSYESILKVILGDDSGNANQLTQKYRDTILRVPATMQTGGFESQVMKSLPFIRNNSGSDHGAGAKEVVISKSMAKLAVNLAAALDTFLIEEYAVQMTETDGSVK